MHHRLGRNTHFGSRAVTRSDRKCQFSTTSSQMLRRRRWRLSMVLLPQSCRASQPHLRNDIADLIHLLYNDLIQTFNSDLINFLNSDLIHLLNNGLIQTLTVISSASLIMASSIP